MQHAWNAAVAAFTEFIDALVNGELIANGVHPATGVRCDLDPAEWTRTGLILDVRNGDLIEGWYGSRAQRSSIRVRWSAIALQSGHLSTKAWEESTGTRSGTRTWLAGNKGQLPNEKAYLREFENAD